MRPSGTRSSGWGWAGGGPRPGSPARTRSMRSKNWRDRLISLAARHPDWVVGYVDEVWWSRLAQPAMHAWGETLRLEAKARANDDAQPKALACYGLLRTDQDRVLLRFGRGAPGQPRHHRLSGLGCRPARRRGQARVGAGVGQCRLARQQSGAGVDWGA